MSQFTQPVALPTRIPGEDSHPWFWNPGRIGVQLAPEWFRTKLHEIDPDLECAWDRTHELWQIWVKKPSLQTKVCQGWQLLFPVHDGRRGYVPLDERTLAKVYSISTRAWDSAKKYFDAVERERERAKDQYERAIEEEDKFKAFEYYAHTQPRVGYGKDISASKMVGQ